MTSEKRIISVFYGWASLLVVKCSLKIICTQTAQMISAGSVYFCLHAYIYLCVCVWDRETETEETETEGDRENQRKKLSIWDLHIRGLLGWNIDNFTVEEYSSITRQNRTWDIFFASDRICFWSHIGLVDAGMLVWFYKCVDNSFMVED